MRCGEHFRSSTESGERGRAGRGDLATTFWRMVTFLPTLMSREGELTRREISERTQESNGRLYCVVELHFGAFSLTLKDALFQCVFCCDSVLTDDHPQKTDIKLKIRNVMADLLFTEVYNPGEPDTMLLFFTV